VAVFLALREMRRNTLRFVLLAGAVGLLVFVLLFFQSLSTALQTSISGAIERLDADVLVYSDRARRSVEGSVIPDGSLEAIGAVDGVAAAAPVGEATFTVRAGEELVDAVVFGVDPGGPGAPTGLSAGRLPEAGGEAAVSRVDDGVGLDIGDTVSTEPGGVELEIVGLLTQAQFSALPTLYTTFADYEAAVRGRNPAAPSVPASLVAVEVERDAGPAAVADRISNEVEGTEALDRATAVASLPGLDTVSQSFAILYGLLFVVVGLVTGIFFLILTVQKRSSLVLLRAVGARRLDVVAPVVLEVLAVVGLGLVAGAALAVPAVRAAGSSLGAEVQPQTVLVTAPLILALGLLAALAAVRRVVQIEPAEVTTMSGLT
jgi:putative ABC transport system permease protein